MKRSVLLVVLITAFTTLLAEKVGITDATNVAINFYRQNVVPWQVQKGIISDYEKAIRVENVKFEVDSLVVDSLVLYYYFNFKPKGVVQVSAVNSMEPVPGHSEEGFVDVKAILKHKNDPGVIPVLDGEILRAQKAYDKLPEIEIIKQWEFYKTSPEKFEVKKNSKSEGKRENSSGKSQTFTKWHQLSPYWYNCPADSVNGHTVVGCVAVAMAQMMKYHQWPETGIGSFEYTLPIWGTQSSDFSQHTYNWAIMPDSAYINTSDSTLQVAQICKDAGVSVNMEYGTSASHPSSDKAYFYSSLSEFFNYTCNDFVLYSSYSGNTAGWYSRIQNEVAMRPIFYNTLSHSMILDGYDAIKGYHINVGNPPPYETLIWRTQAQLEAIGTPLSIITDIIPDRNDNPLPIPYSQNFDSILKNEIPANTASLHNNSVQELYGFENTYHLKALLDNNSSTVAVPDSSWFLIKKIILACDSVPVLKFKYRIDKTLNPVSLNPGDSITVEVSKDNRLSWKQISSITSSNHPYTTDYQDRIVSLNEFKNEIVNVRFKYFLDPNTASINYRLDNLEIGLLELSFPELTNDMTLSPKTAQSVKVSPSIYTPPKSKGFEEYDMIMDFYVKENIEEAEYALTYSDSVLENGVFEYPDLNTDDFIGKDIKVRAVARAKSSSLTLKSAEISLKISGRQCSVDLPLPATESWFDFETRLNVSGSILAEPSFADSLSNIYVWFDIYDDYWSQVYSDYYQEEVNISVLEQYYYDWEYYCDSTAYFCEFEKKSAPREYRPNREIITDKSKLKRTRKLIPASDLVKDKSDSKDLTVHQLFTYRYPISLNLYPGTYTVFFGAIRKDLYDYDETISEIAKCDSLQFIIPQWKMKLRRDYWFANTEVPYKQNLEYEAGKVMQIIFWRPWYLDPYYPLYLNIERETDHTVVQNYQVDFNTKASYDLIEWTIPAETVPGFYNLKASNVDYWTDIPVNEQIDPQVCPLYLSWENSGNWPTNWPGSDSWDWEIHPGTEWTPAQGAYAMGAKYSTEGNTGKLSIEKSITIDSQWNKVLEFAIGLEKGEGATNFDPLLANYSIATSKDGANWVIEKTANVSDYTSITWGTAPAHCFRKTFKPLGNISNFGIKFIKEGIVTSPPDSQIVLFDEVKVDLSKIPPKIGPTDPSAQYAGGNVSTGWTGASKSNKALDNYYVYRNGIKIGETMAESFVDSTVSANTFYNYAITAHYDDGSLFPESPMNECTVSIYTGLYSPSNLVITNEDPNIKLTWSAVTGASEYKVYSSDDPYGTFAEDTTGTFDGEEWTAPISTSRLFYYVVAVNESMKEKKIKEDSLSRVK